MFCNVSSVHVFWSAQQTYVQHAESKQIICSGPCILDKS